MLWEGWLPFQPFVHLLDLVSRASHCPPQTVKSASTIVSRSIATIKMKAFDYGIEPLKPLLLLTMNPIDYYYDVKSDRSFLVLPL